MQLICLGTSGATPTKERNLISTALRLDSGDIVLFDAGEDVQRRFQAANLKFNVPTIILITHLHGDHIIGLPGLLFNFHLNSRTQSLLIIGPLGLASYLSSQHQYIGLKAQNYNLQVWEIFPIQTMQKGNNLSENSKIDESDNKLGFQIIKYDQFLKPEYNRSKTDTISPIVFENQEICIESYLLNHSVLNLGYRIIENPRNGKFNPERAIELQIPRKKWKILQQGISIELANGKKINPEDLGIVTQKRPGRIIAYTGDTAKCDNLSLLAADADYLICEATYLIIDEQKAIEKHHMSSRFAAEIACDAHVKTLIMTHFSSRYDSAEIMQFQKEAQQIHPQSIAAHDLLAIDIKLKNGD